MKDSTRCVTPKEEEEEEEEEEEAIFRTNSPLKQRQRYSAKAEVK